MNLLRITVWPLAVGAGVAWWQLPPRPLAGPLVRPASENSTIPACANIRVANSLATREVPPLPLGDDARLRLVLRSGFLHDLEGLQTRLHALPAGLARWRVLSLAVEVALLEGRAPEAVVWLREIPGEYASPELRNWAAEVWGATHPDAAVRWAIAEPDAAVRESLLGRLSIGVAQSDPVAAIAFARQFVPPGDTFDQTLAGIAARWADTEPAAAADWARHLPDDAVRQSTLKLVLAPWFNRAPEATHRWIAEQPAGLERDRLWSLVTDWQIQNNPALATPLLKHITPGVAQDTAALNLVRHWAHADFAQAGEWVLQLPTTPLRDLLVTELEQVARNLGQTTP